MLSLQKRWLLTSLGWWETRTSLQWDLAKLGLVRKLDLATLLLQLSPVDSVSLWALEYDVGVRLVNAPELGFIGLSYHASHLYCMTHVSSPQHIVAENYEQLSEGYKMFVSIAMYLALDMS